MKYFLWVVLSLLIMGCNQNQPRNENSTEIDTTAFNKTLDITNEEVVLLPEVTEFTQNWLAYITAQNEIENFREYTLNEIVSNARPIAEIMLNLRETLPDTLTTNAVQARLNVLYTKAKVLEQEAQMQHLDLTEITKTAEEIPVEFNNFNIQLNEIFQKTLEDFELELEEFESENETLEDTLPLRLERNNR